MPEVGSFDLGDEVGLITIDDLQQLPTDDVKEVRSYPWPACRCVWRVKEAKIEAMERSVSGQAEKKRLPGLVLVMECVEPLDITDTDKQYANLDVDDLIGREFTHRNAANNGLEDWLGRIKAMMIDTGFTPPPGRGLGDQLHEWIGTQFEASIAKRRDRDNSDVVYTNLNTMAGQIKPRN